MAWQIARVHDGRVYWQRAARINAEPVTVRQAEALAAIHAHRATHGRPPTVRELAATLGVHSSAAHVLMLYLVRAGHLHRDGNRRPRALRLATDRRRPA